MLELRPDCGFTLVVLLALGCGASPDPTMRTDPAKVSTNDAASPSAASAGPRRRHAGRAPSAHKKPLPSSSGDTTELNVRRNGLEFIIIDADNSCFYESIEGMPMHTPGINPWRRIVIDCPAEYDDTAWDDCVLGRMRGIRGDKNCECQNSGATEQWATGCPK